MTIFEVLLALALLIVLVQVIILQRYYNDKLSEQADVLNCLMNYLVKESVTMTNIDKVKVKAKIFESSQ